MMAKQLSILIIAPESGTAEALRTAVSSGSSVASVDIADTLAEATRVLSTRSVDIDAIIVDIFEFSKPQEVADWIFNVRSERPAVVFGLFGGEEQFRAMAGLTENAASRLKHYYRLLKEVPIAAVPYAVDRLLLQFNNYIAASGTKARMLEVRRTIEKHQSKDGMADVSAIFSKLIEEHDASLLRRTDSDERAPFAPFVFVDAANFQKMVLASVEEARRALRHAKLAHLFVVSVGIVMILASTVAVLLGASWEVVSLGGLGMAGLVGALITSPLKTVSQHASRMVRLELAYFSHLSVIQIASRAAMREAGPDVMVKLGEQTRALMAELDKDK